MKLDINIMSNLNNILILIEGKDEHFINRYLKHLKIDTTCITVISIGGYTSLGTAEDDIKQCLNLDKSNKQNGKLLIIFDADYKDKGEGEQKGGVGLRTKYIENKLQDIASSQDIQIDKSNTSIFLFPNNRNDGDFETLLEGIVPEEKKNILECFNEFSKCINHKGYEIPLKKSKIYAYLDTAIPKNEVDDDRKILKKGNFFNFQDDSKYWNFNSPKLDPLKEFLKKNIK